MNQNNLEFNVTAAITKVDCPIMMMHAEDDDVIPYHLGRKVIFKLNIKFEFIKTLTYFSYFLY